MLTCHGCVLYAEDLKAIIDIQRKLSIILSLGQLLLRLREQRLRRQLKQSLMHVISILIVLLQTCMMRPPCL